MSRMPSIAETVEQVLRDASGGHSVKMASEYAPVKERGPAILPLKKVASALRNMPEPELSYSILHVVKTAMIRGDIGPLPAPEFNSEEGTATNAGLRKLANELRAEDHDDHSRLLAKGAHVLKAGRGVMLLRELVRE